MLRSYLALASIALFAAGPLLAAPPEKGAKDKEAQKEDEHEHSHVGPHKGQLVELGEEEYHAEVVHDDKASSVTVYVLDGEAKAAVAVAAKEIVITAKVAKKAKSFKLKAAPQKTDKAGTTTRFSAVSKELIEVLDSEDGHPELKIAIGDKTFTGKIPHAHDHDHDEDVPKPKKPAPKE